MEVGRGLLKSADLSPRHLTGESRLQNATLSQHNLMKIITCFSLLLLASALAGCQTRTYVTPGPRADLAGLAPVEIRESFEREPTNPFPASIVAVRLQGSGYTNYSLGRRGGAYDKGPYSIVLAREIEEDDDFERILNLPEVSNLISLNRMLIPERVHDIDDLRRAAARLRADLLFVYTFDTTFFDENKARPLSAITLGFSPTRKVTATTTASALIVDTRSGFIYGALESTEVNGRLSTTWGSREAADKARLSNERAAFLKLLDELENVWPRLLPQTERKVGQKSENE